MRAEAIEAQEEAARSRHELRDLGEIGGDGGGAVRARP